MSEMWRTRNWPPTASKQQIKNARGHIGRAETKIEHYWDYCPPERGPNHKVPESGCWITETAY